MEDIGRVYVIGMGEVGRRLATALDRGGAEVIPVTRDSGWDEALQRTPGTRLVCTREEELEAVLARLEPVPRSWLCLVQNGWIRPLLDQPGQITRGLIWFTCKGEFFRELRPSPFSGPLAIPLVRALAAGGLMVAAMSEEVFASLDAEKMGFNCVVGLPLAVSGLSLGDYLEQHEDEARELFTESVQVCAAAVGRQADEQWWSDFVASVQPLGWVKASRAKALGFRNGAVVELGRQLGMQTPVNQQLLAAHG